MVVGAEIIATEAVTDGFKVNEKPAENVEQVNKEEPFGDVKNIREVHLDHSLLNNIQASGEMRTDYVFLISHRFLEGMVS